MVVEKHVSGGVNIGIVSWKFVLLQNFADTLGCQMFRICNIKLQLFHF